jgi:hypothetical protein
MSTTAHAEFLRTRHHEALHREAKSKSDFEALELRLDNAGLPKWEWRKQVLQCFITLKHEWEKDLKTVLRLGRELKAFETPASKTEGRPTAKPVQFYDNFYSQAVEVRIVDGKTVTRFDFDGAHWIKADAWHMVSSFRRTYRFFGKQVPPEYAFVLQHNGLRYSPTEMVYMHYEAAEFKRICHLEVETQSPHALDGQRLNYWRRHDTEPLGPVEDEQKGSEQ